jgi:hypothetical protein
MKKKAKAATVVVTDELYVYDIGDEDEVVEIDDEAHEDYILSICPVCGDMYTCDHGMPPCSHMIVMKEHVVHDLLEYAIPGLVEGLAKRDKYGTNKLNVEPLLRLIRGVRIIGYEHSDGRGGVHQVAAFSENAVVDVITALGRYYRDNEFIYEED